MYAGPSASFQLTFAIRLRWQTVNAELWSNLGNESSMKKNWKTKDVPHWTPFALAARLRKKKKNNMPGSSKVQMRIILVEYDRYAWKPQTGGWRGGVSLLNLPRLTTVDVTHDVFWPGYAGSLFGQTAAAGCLWVCASVWWEGEGGVGLWGSFIKLKKKIIKETQNISVPGLVS